MNSSPSSLLMLDLPFNSRFFFSLLYKVAVYLIIIIKNTRLPANKSKTLYFFIVLIIEVSPSKRIYNKIVL